jgi:hypothetical protein
MPGILYFSIFVPNASSKIFKFFSKSGGCPNSLPVWAAHCTQHRHARDIQSSNWSKQGSVYDFLEIPIYDSPILIVDKTLINGMGF